MEAAASPMTGASAMPTMRRFRFITSTATGTLSRTRPRHLGGNLMHTTTSTCLAAPALFPDISLTVGRLT
jgi:hypothetical protein